MRDIFIICTPLRFYSPYDEVVLFEWIKKIPCIKKVEGIGRALHLYISSPVSNEEMRECIGLFRRYKFKNDKQLEQFKNDHNKHWFDN
jgi:hypothetical protein